MTGKEDNVGFLTTGSGVKQFQLSFWRCAISRRRRLPAAGPYERNGPSHAFKIVAQSSVYCAFAPAYQEAPGLSAAFVPAREGAICDSAAAEKCKHPTRCFAGLAETAVLIFSGGDNQFGFAGNAGVRQRLSREVLSVRSEEQQYQPSSRAWSIPRSCRLTVTATHQIAASIFRFLSSHACLLNCPKLNSNRQPQGPPPASPSHIENDLTFGFKR